MNATLFKYTWFNGSVTVTMLVPGSHGNVAKEAKISLKNIIKMTVYKSHSNGAIAGHYSNQHNTKRKENEPYTFG